MSEFYFNLDILKFLHKFLLQNNSIIISTYDITKRVT